MTDISRTAGINSSGSPDGDDCPIETAAHALEGKWTMLIVRELLGGRRRFGDLAAALPQVRAKTLTERLRWMEAQKVVHRTVVAEWPRHVEYELTDAGQDLEPVLVELWRWGSHLQERRRA